jgi:hypothetical protein
MNKFQIHSDVCYTVDSSGVSVINKDNHKAIFISYPEAAVWLVLNQKYTQDKSISLIGAILDDMEEDSLKYVDSCISKWKDLGLVK